MSLNPPLQKLFSNKNFTLRRGPKYVVAELNTPHTVLCSSFPLGGTHTHLTHLVNHQMGEGSHHEEHYQQIHQKGPTAYHREFCQQQGWDPENTACMGTAANLQNAIYHTQSFEDSQGTFTCHLVVTAGVEGNAGTAGDPAQYIEAALPREGVPEKESKAEPVGTINYLAILDRPVHTSALMQLYGVIVEAKASMLQRLGVGSRYSSHIATGTGTDQVILACPSHGELKLMYGGKHTKLGETLGKAVLHATQEALRWQNGLEPAYQRSLVQALKRFGLQEKSFLSLLATKLPTEDFARLKANWNAVKHHPGLSGVAYGMAGTLDKIHAGVLEELKGQQVLRQQSALAAYQLSESPQSFLECDKKLAELPFDLNAYMTEAVAQGWLDKWK